tara:strand:+ start:143 stop:472 length:330 start_codon:yes stop_codon:yes gene_type:complete
MKKSQLRKIIQEEISKEINESNIPRSQYRLGKRALGELVSNIMPTIVDFIETKRLDTVSSGMRGQLTRGGVESKEEFIKRQIKFLGDSVGREINRRMEELADRYIANLD